MNMNQPNIKIRQTEFLEDLPAAEAEQLSRLSELRKYKDKDMVFEKGDKLPGLFVVSKGGLKIFRAAGEDRIQIVDIVKPGQCIGEAMVFSNSNAVTNAEAWGDTECWVIPSDALRQIVQQNPIVSKAMLKHLAGKILHMVPLVETLSLRNVPERVAQLILDYLAKTPGKKIVEFQERQEELAQHIGVSREAFNRALRFLDQEKGLIRSTFPVVRITDVQKLKRYSKG